MKGTTSNPKGVLLTHGNLAAATQSNLYALDIPDKGRMLSYLPLAHIYEASPLPPIYTHAPTSDLLLARHGGRCDLRRWLDRLLHRRPAPTARGRAVLPTRVLPVRATRAEPYLPSGNGRGQRARRQGSALPPRG
jgi:hypothetical protein